MNNGLRFKALISMVMIAAGVCVAQDDSTESSDFPVLTEPYLGQKPPGQEPEVFAPGVVTRSDYWEHSSPAFSHDGTEVYWSAQIGPRKQRIFYMKSEDGRWSAPEPAPFWMDRHGGGPVFSPDGKRLYFYSKAPESDLAGEKSINIWYVEKDGVRWRNPKRLDSIINAHESSTGSPSFDRDGTMYFNSRRDVGHGKGDMYSSKFENGQFTSPVNLGQNVNTEDNEYGGCVAPDGSYLLLSRSTEEPKGVSIYVSFRKTDSSWAVAQELGGIIELCRKARFPGVSPDGKYIFFCATKDRDVKIYWVDARVLDELRPEEPK